MEKLRLVYIGHNLTSQYKRQYYCGFFSRINSPVTPFVIIQTTISGGAFICAGAILLVQWRIYFITTNSAYLIPIGRPEFLCYKLLICIPNLSYPFFMATALMDNVQHLSHTNPHISPVVRTDAAVR